MRHRSRVSDVELRADVRADLGLCALASKLHRKLPLIGRRKCGKRCLDLEVAGRFRSVVRSESQ